MSDGAEALWDKQDVGTSGSAPRSNVESKSAPSSSSSNTPASDRSLPEIGDLSKKLRGDLNLGNETSRLNSDGSYSSQNSYIVGSRILHSIEGHTRAIASNLDEVLRDLRGSLHGMSDLTVESSGCYADTIATTCDSADAAIKNTYALLAKVEELGEAMGGVRKLAQQIKEIKQIVDSFEVQFISGSL